MTEYFVLAAALAGMVAGGALAWLALRSRLSSLESEREQFRKASAKAHEESLALRTAETRLESERAANSERVAALERVREQIQKDLQLLAEDVLKGTSESFLKRAREVFEQQQKESRAGIKGLVEPIDAKLKEYQEKLAEMEKDRREGQGRLDQHIRQVVESTGTLRETTDGLVNALRYQAKTRGRWGEHQLRRVLEMAGMLEHVDYELEVTVRQDNGRQRPDAVLTMPGGRTIVIDAKTPMSAYLDALEAETDEDTERLLHDHARQLREHARSLGSKSYWNLFSDTPDFVVMFIPGDNFYAAAVERDPALFDDAYRQHVIIATPTTLLALAKAIAYGWRQEQASRNARQVLQIGEDLYKRLESLGDRLGKLSSALDRAVRAHNEFVGSFENRALPGARRLRSLEVGQKDIESPGGVETAIRVPRAPQLDLAETNTGFENGGKPVPDRIND